MFTKRCSEKSRSGNVFFIEVFLQWSKSSTKDFISITDLINYRKYS